MNAALHRFVQLTACATFVLIVAGGLVTSTGSSLAVPDWPLSYGELFPPMVGGIFYEHGHRMIAAAVAILTAVMAIWLQLREPRLWVRRLGWIALGTVIAQAVLGGITVLYLLPPAVSVSHAAMAMLFFSTLSSLALFTSRQWSEPVPPFHGEARPPLGLATALAIAIYVQILLGAVMRHTGAGLAIATFPLADGDLFPPLTSFAVAINFAHRLGAVAVTGLMIAVTVRVARIHAHEPRLVRPAAFLLLLLVLQIALGAYTVWTAKAVLPTTAHVATGALMLVIALRLSLQAARLRHRVESLQARPFAVAVA